MAQMPIVESSLSPADASELLMYHYMRFGQGVGSIVKSFVILSQDIDADMQNLPDGQNSQLLSLSFNALRNIQDLQNLVPTSFDVIRIQVAILSLGFVVKTSSTMDFFRRNSPAIMECFMPAIQLHESDKQMLSLYLSSVMGFWLAIDQISIQHQTSITFENGIQRDITITESVGNAMLALDDEYLTERKFFTAIMMLGFSHPNIQVRIDGDRVILTGFPSSQSLSQEDNEFIATLRFLLAIEPIP